MAEPPRKKAKNIEKSSPNTSVPVAFFNGMKAVVIENGLGKTRSAILRQKLTKHGGCVQQKLDSNSSHVFVSSAIKYERIPKLLGLNQGYVPNNVIILSAEWISMCLLENRHVDMGKYVITPPGINKNPVEANEQEENQEDKLVNSHEVEKSNLKSLKNNQTLAAGKSKQGDDDSDYNASDAEEEISSKCSPEKTKGTWICALPSTSQGVNHNQLITDKLQILATSYTNTKDQWRALGYKKAIASIKAYHKPIETQAECSEIPFVGERLAKKIWEIIETGHLRRLDHMDPKIEAINLFSDVWGAGPKAAESWATSGFRTLQDLETKATLTSQQRIGLKYFHEFRERMPRDEAGKIGEEVHKVVHEIDLSLVSETCGSYRRGKTTCGDVDVLVSHPDGRSHKGILPDIITKLKSNGFITDDLVSVHSEQNKYMGVCKLPGDSHKHRRLDIIVKPYCEYACAKMYFTGSDYFNRSMRLLAKKNNMSLTEHSLNTGVVRHGGEKVFEGTPLPVNSEKDIFKYLGLSYRPPEERDW